MEALERKALHIMASSALKLSRSQADYHRGLLGCNNTQGIGSQRFSFHTTGHQSEGTQLARRANLVISPTSRILKSPTQSVKTL
jgi:hypothetical protein